LGAAVARCLAFFTFVVFDISLTHTSQVHRLAREHLAAHAVYSIAEREITEMQTEKMFDARHFPVFPPVPVSPTATPSRASPDVIPYDPLNYLPPQSGTTELSACIAACNPHLFPSSFTSHAAMVQELKMLETLGEAVERHKMLFQRELGTLNPSLHRRKATPSFSIPAKQHGTRSKGTCRRCGNTGHDRRNCPYPASRNEVDTGKVPKKRKKRNDIDSNSDEEDNWVWDPISDTMVPAGEVNFMR
jgi:hypothetical protein